MFFFVILANFDAWKSNILSSSEMHLALPVVFMWYTSFPVQTLLLYPKILSKKALVVKLH